MANVVTLHKRQLFNADGTPASGAQVSFYQTGTVTQVSVYSDTALLIERAQPVICDANGVLPVCYTDGGAALRIQALDEDDVALPGYPMDNVTPEPTGDSAAAEISFSPTETLPYTNVQAAIVGAAALLDDQTDIISRTFTVWTTGGTGNDYTISPSPAITSYASGQAFLVRPDRANTGAASMAINSLGARPLRKANSAGAATALVAGDIFPGREFLATVDGSNVMITLNRDFPIYGANANGHFTKFADGTMICRKRLINQGPISTALGSLFQSATISLGDWAATFSDSDINLSIVTSNADAAHSWFSHLDELTTTSAGRGVMLRATTSASTIYAIRVTGIGRWFA